MLARNKQRQERHSSAAAGTQPGPGATPADSTFLLLLSLPHAVLAQHVWPLLSSWGRAQLRATCKELRQLSDGLLEGTMHFHVPVEQPQNVRACAQSRAALQQHIAHHSTAPLQGLGHVQEWEGKCALLARCPRVQSLALQVDTTFPPDKLQQLATAAAGRITCLRLDHSLLSVQHMYRNVAMFADMCPALRVLHVRFANDVSPSWNSSVPAPLGLPATLESLSLQFEYANAAQIWPAFAGALAASTQLTRLHSLRVGFSHVGLQVDVSPLVPIASHLSHLHVDWDSGVRRGVTGLPQLLAACSTSLTSLALPLRAPAAPDQPSLAQVLAAAPNLQQLEVLRGRAWGDHRIQPITAADVRALHTHPTLRRLVIRCQELRSQLARAALPHGSMQHLEMELHCDQYNYTAEELLQLLSGGALSAGCRLVRGPFGALQVNLGAGPPLDADLLSRLTRALRDSGVQIVREAAAEEGGHVAGSAVRTLPDVLGVGVGGSLEQLADQQAVAAVLSSLPRLQLASELSVRFCQEAEAVRAGSSDGLWLLPALARVSTLALPRLHSDEMHRFAAALSTVLSHGYMPQLQRLACEGASVKDESVAYDLVALAQLLKASCVKPDLVVVPLASEGLNVASINQLRAALDGIPAPKATTHKPKGKSREGSSSAGSQGRQSGVTLDDEGRSLLLQRLLC